MQMFVMIDASTAARGFSIALTGLVIVFAVLILICTFIASLPRVLEIVARILPEVSEHHGLVPLETNSHDVSADEDEKAILAGIGFVLHAEFQKAGSRPGVASER